MFFGGGAVDRESDRLVQYPTPRRRVGLTLPASHWKRGGITVWFEEDTVDAWNAAPGGRPGGQRRYSER